MGRDMICNWKIFETFQSNLLCQKMSVIQQNLQFIHGITAWNTVPEHFSNDISPTANVVVLL